MLLGKWTHDLESLEREVVKKKIKKIVEFSIKGHSHPPTVWVNMKSQVSHWKKQVSYMTFPVKVIGIFHLGKPPN